MSRGSIVTRGGAWGETSLLYGGRVPKDDLHNEADGALDEAISALGLARASLAGVDDALAERILALQRELFTVGAELATGRGEHHLLEKHFATVTAAMVDALETEVHDLEARGPLPQAVVVPGGSAAAAAPDPPRPLLRRAERRSLALRRA